MQVARELVELPPDVVWLRADGKVREVEDWTLWNGSPTPTVHIERRGDDEFISNISWGDGGRQTVGTLEEVLEGLHPDIAAKYVKLFALENPTEADLAAIGFERHEIRRKRK